MRDPQGSTQPRCSHHVHATRQHHLTAQTYKTRTEFPDHPTLETRVAATHFPQATSPQCVIQLDLHASQKIPWANLLLIHHHFKLWRVEVACTTKFPSAAPHTTTSASHTTTSSWEECKLAQITRFPWANLLLTHHHFKLREWKSRRNIINIDPDSKPAFTGTDDPA